MKHLFIILSASFLSLYVQATPVISLKKGLVIKESVMIKQDTYFLNANVNLKQALIVIEGKDIVVDFNQSVLQGSVNRARPDEFFGLAVYIKKGSENITLKNASIHGYKIAVFADSVQNFKIEDCNLSYNYKQQLHSNIFREDVSDWMSYHHNEENEWMRYGAALYLKNCSNAVISNNIVTGGQCALMMTKCNNGSIYKNNFSFNSGIGIGLYRSSNNKIYNNVLDFNVRGYSDGVYNRGQDSAGILVFEQCNNNVFAYNSVTHSGDGFFLWAGQYTMETGNGGCNDNLLYGNDFSYAPTNGVEVTFSKNNIENNIIKECDNGIWGGYSYHTNIVGNDFSGNKTAIAIEHGQENLILMNQFKDDTTAIKLWSRTSQPADWIYAQKRDTRSRNYSIINNSFSNEKIVFDLRGTDSINLESNNKINCEQVFKIGEGVTNLDTSAEQFSIKEIKRDKDERLDSIPVSALAVNDSFAGKEFIRVTQWGPYNYRYPLLWLNKIDSNGNYHFDVLGASGKWKIVSVKGFEIKKEDEQTFPSTIVAKPVQNAKNSIITLQYKGEAFTDARGKKHKKDEPYLFSYKQFDLQTKWKVEFYKWSKKQDPNKSYKQFQTVLNKKPVYTETTNNINYTWWNSIGENLPADSFATVATATIDLPADEYEVAVTADDLVRLYIDGKQIINAWNAKAIKNDEDLHHKIKMRLAGKHQFKIVHAENAGLATLMFYLHPVSYALP